MALETQKYQRKPFAVDAVEVTQQNMYDVARWCGGKVQTAGAEDPARRGQKYIKVQVKKPLDDRQTQAYVGDWVLSSGQGPWGFKVYTPKAFESSFEKQVDRMFEVVSRMDKRVKAEEQAEEEDEITADQLQIGNASSMALTLTDHPFRFPTN